MTKKAPTPPSKQPDALRRKLTKTGLAAPVVLATLASKPVLGAAPHNCTISGQLSGNTSTHAQGTCSTLGKSPTYYGGLPPASWPNAANDFLNSSGNPRKFLLVPFTFSPTSRFVDAYEKEKLTGTNIGAILPASVWDVLKGFAVLEADGSQNHTWRLQVRSGYFSDLELGREAIAAYMNAFSFYPDYPLTPARVVQIFNAVVVNGGGYEVAPGVIWYAADVLNYFRSLHD
jgi:hypothetical protein